MSLSFKWNCEKEHIVDIATFRQRQAGRGRCFGRKDGEDLLKALCI